MKVSVYKGENGTLSVLVQASLGSGLAPVMVPEVTRENIQEKIRPVIDAMKRRRNAGQELPLPT